MPDIPTDVHAAARWLDDHHDPPEHIAEHLDVLLAYILSARQETPPDE